MPNDSFYFSLKLMVVRSVCWNYSAVAPTFSVVWVVCLVCLVCACNVFSVCVCVCVCVCVVCVVCSMRHVALLIQVVY